MKVGVYFNKHYISENKQNVERICGVITKSGADCIVVNGIQDLDGLDILFVLGGDGTILMVATECAKRGIKILGINYGHLGFLAEFEPDKVDEALALVRSGNYKTQKRSVIEIECGGKTYLALNDVVVQRSTCGNDFSNTINLRAEIDGSTVDKFSSDGIIISTPTGSTAYSLSAGGSVLTPDINAFIMTPICAHSLHSRPVVYNDGSVLKIHLLSSGAMLNIIVDGRIVDTLDSSKTVIAKKSSYYVEFITRDETDFFKKLLIKLNKWSK